MNSGSQRRIETVGEMTVRSAVADDIPRSVSFGIGRKNTADAAPVDHPLDTQVILHGGGPDESPHVYRRLPDVLAAR